MQVVVGVLTFVAMLTVDGRLVLEILTLQANAKLATTTLGYHPGRLGGHLLSTLMAILKASGGGDIFAQTTTTGSGGRFWANSVLKPTMKGDFYLLQTSLRYAGAFSEGCIPLTFSSDS